MELVCGVDEAGRGPLAGPVTAAAVILPEDFDVGILDDSKRLSEKQRLHLSALIRSQSVAWSVGWASHGEIDTINILRASLLAMKRAIFSLQFAPQTIIVDGLHVPDVPYPASAIVKADALVPAVMAASILAKTARDQWMRDYSVLEPRYGFEKHKGYPTPAHKECIRRLGRCAIHRRSFRVF